MRRFLTLTSVLAVSAVLAACSTGGDGPEATDAPTTAATEAATEATTEAAAPATTEPAAGTPGVTGGTDTDDDDVVGSCAGVALVIDTGDLDDDRDDAVEDTLDAAEGAWCIDTDAAITAREALDLVGVTTEGTTEYGDAILCRVNGVPAADLPLVNSADGSSTLETCASMPPAHAYWSVWLKPAGGEWGYAMEGVDTQKLAPGEALELLFTLNGAPATP